MESKLTEEERIKRNEYQKKWKKDNYEKYHKKRTENREKNKEKIAKQQKLYNEKNKDKIKEYHKQHQIDNKDKISEYGKKRYQENKEKISKQHKIYYENNKDIMLAGSKKWREKNKEKMKEYCKEYDKKNKDKLAKRKKEYRSRPEVKERTRISGKKHDAKRRKDPIFRFNQNMSRAINLSLKKNNLSKNGRHWEDLVGYTSQELRDHLEKQFSQGMTWEYRSKWHIDHIVPKSSFKIKEVGDSEFMKCWGLENLQPLWAIDNIRKKDRLDWEQK